MVGRQSLSSLIKVCYVVKSYIVHRFPGCLPGYVIYITLVPNFIYGNRSPGRFWQGFLIFHLNIFVSFPLFGENLDVNLYWNTRENIIPSPTGNWFTGFLFRSPSWLLFFCMAKSILNRQVFILLFFSRVISNIAPFVIDFFPS